MPRSEASSETPQPARDGKRRPRRRRTFRSYARRVKLLVRATMHAFADPQTPWYAKALAVLVVAYAASPIDLIPDFIPILGYLDDLVLLPLGVALVLRLIPRDVRLRSLRLAVRGRARLSPAVRIAGAAIVIIVWLIIVYAIVRAIVGAAGPHATAMRGIGSGARAISA